MAKKNSTSSTRDASHIASRKPFVFDQAWDNKAAAALSSFKPKPIYLDRRAYRPDESTRPPTIHTPLASRITLQIIKVRQRRRAFHAKIDKYTNPFHYPKTYLRTRLGFSVPRRIEACIRRGVRKEVLHAKRKTGKSGQRKPVRNFWSAISC